MGNIDWIPIADMPDALKDGREVLFSCDDGHGNWRTIGKWDAEFGWVDDGGAWIEVATHFAEINAPDTMVVDVKLGRSNWLDPLSA